jgi:hypothetical protein
MPAAKHFMKAKRRSLNVTALLITAVLAIVSGFIVMSVRAAASADINRDGQVGILDLSALLTQWARTGAVLSGDLNLDGTVTILDLSHLLTQWGPAAVAPTPGPAQEYVIDNATRTMTINPVGDFTANLDTLVTQLEGRSDQNELWTLRFMPGTYTLTSDIVMTELKNVHITSVNTASPAVITKTSMSVEYFFTCRYCSSIRISYLTFEGVTTAYDPNAVHWPDQGVWFGSSHDTRVDHSTFRHIGNAALRHNTRTDDPILGVNSYNHYIEDNTFEKVWQVTTTQDSGTTHGGSRDWWVQRNTFNQVYGSLKFCSRTSGAERGHILNNTFSNAYNGPIELCSTTDVEISNNTFQNNPGLVVSSYTNDAAGAGFQWGDNITFSNNTITGSVQGLRFDYTPYPDSFQAVGHNLVISGNTFLQITDTDPNRGTIRVVNGIVDNVDILNNTFTSVTTNDLFDLGSSTNVTIQGNTRDGVQYP